MENKNNHTNYTSELLTASEVADVFQTLYSSGSFPQDRAHSIWLWSLCFATLGHLPHQEGEHNSTTLNEQSSGLSLIQIKNIFNNILNKEASIDCQTLVDAPPLEGDSIDNPFPVSVPLSSSGVAQWLGHYCVPLQYNYVSLLLNLCKDKLQAKQSAHKGSVMSAKMRSFGIFFLASIYTAAFATYVNNSYDMPFMFSIPAAVLFTIFIYYYAKTINKKALKARVQKAFYSSLGPSKKSAASIEGAGAKAAEEIFPKKALQQIFEGAAHPFGWANNAVSDQLARLYQQSKVLSKMLKPYHTAAAQDLTRMWTQDIGALLPLQERHEQKVLAALQAMEHIVKNHLEEAVWEEGKKASIQEKYWLSKLTQSIEV